MPCAELPCCLFSSRLTPCRSEPVQMIPSLDADKQPRLTCPSLHLVGSSASMMLDADYYNFTNCMCQSSYVPVYTPVSTGGDAWVSLQCETQVGGGRSTLQGPAITKHVQVLKESMHVPVVPCCLQPAYSCCLTQVSHECHQTCVTGPPCDNMCSSIQHLKHLEGNAAASCSLCACAPCEFSSIASTYLTFALICYSDHTPGAQHLQAAHHSGGPARASGRAVCHWGGGIQNRAAQHAV